VSRFATGCNRNRFRVISTSASRGPKMCSNTGPFSLMTKSIDVPDSMFCQIASGMSGLKVMVTFRGAGARFKPMITSASLDSISFTSTGVPAPPSIELTPAALGRIGMNNA
jgi:hypothetical protein